MSKVADYTLKGFLYQFNVTLESLLSDENDSNTVTVEGIIEDVDIETEDGYRAIQCKYHETVDSYSLSHIYKPVLQMMVHYSQNPTINIKYILYAHFPNESVGIKPISEANIQEILQTTDISYITKYISKLKPASDERISTLIEKSRKTASDKEKIREYYFNNSIDLCISIDEFLNKERFEFKIGESFDELVTKNIQLLESESTLKTEDVMELFYPNAIQNIADKSIKHLEDERKISKKELVSALESTKKVAVTRWLKELNSYQRILLARRNQLKANLRSNHRLRYFLFNVSEIEDFSESIVGFIATYVEKYHHKIPLHDRTPLFCIFSEQNLIKSIQSRLYKIRIVSCTGYHGDVFFQKDFIREPKIEKSPEWREFHIRLGSGDADMINIINENKCNDLFVVGCKSILNSIETMDVNLEHLDVQNLSELKYLLSLTDTVD